MLKNLQTSDISVCIQKVKDAEVDEMWSYVGNKKNQRWLWHAIDHATGKILAYAFGDRKDVVFLKLKKLLEPFGITRFFTDFPFVVSLSNHLSQLQCPSINSRRTENYQPLLKML